MKKPVKKTEAMYEAPHTEVIRVAVESPVCSGSEVTKIKADNPNVEVDEWDSFENEVTFD